MKRLGVVGSLVWDRIHRPPAPQPTESWGGIAYSLAALAAACPSDWEVVPLLKVGGDLAADADELLRSLPCLSLKQGVRVVPEPNNRVELHYVDEARRFERLTGGVPSWSWDELEPLIAGLDALYVNFISGFELDLRTARCVRDRFRGPIYVDLHSLLLGRARDGRRMPRPLPDARDWLHCFDAVQVNEEELHTFAESWSDPRPTSAAILGAGPLLVVETRGARGALLTAAADLPPHPLDWPEFRTRHGEQNEAARLLRLFTDPADAQGAAADRRSGDPTGCGDVWGSTFFLRLLAGDRIDAALEKAGAAAARNFRGRGTSQLYERLAAAPPTPRE